MINRKSYGEMKESIMKKKSGVQWCLARLMLCMRHSIKVHVSFAAIVDQEGLKNLSSLFNVYQQFNDRTDSDCTQLVTSFLNEFPNGQHPMYEPECSMTVLRDDQKEDQGEEDLQPESIGDSTAAAPKHVAHLLNVVARKNSARIQDLSQTVYWKNWTCPYSVIRFIFCFNSAEVAVSKLYLLVSI